MSDIPKNKNKLIQEYAALVHDRELSSTLKALQAEFDLWETGEISAEQLSNQIHKFHQGPLKKIWAKYEMSSKEAMIASAIASGILQEEGIPDELMEHLGRMIEFYRNELAE